MYISTNIRFLRKSKGLTQEELASRLNKHSVSISDYEKGKSTPPIDVALQLCKIFGVDLNSMVTKDLEKEGISKEKSKPSSTETDLKKEYEFLHRLNRLQELRLAELEREIREHAPKLAKRLGL